MGGVGGNETRPADNAVLTCVPVSKPADGIKSAASKVHRRRHRSIRKIDGHQDSPSARRKVTRLSGALLVSHVNPPAHRAISCRRVSKKRLCFASVAS